MRTEAGVIDLRVDYGQDARDGHWGCPIRELWGLTSHQQLSLALEDKLAFTVTATSTYEEAVAVAGKWGVPVSRAALHQLTQRLGERAEKQSQRRMKAVPEEAEPQRKPTQLAVLMLDGWQVRQRGPGWGKKKTQQKRVEWHEWKTGVYYRQEQAGTTASGRGVITDKVVVGWQGEPLEFGRRLHWEAMRGGLARAQAKLVVGDGAPWIWAVAQDRWKDAFQLLDFYHASQHLWETGRALHGTDDAAARWVEPRRHQLRHGGERKLLGEIAGIKPPRGEAGKVVAREQNYFASHAQRMNYRSVHRRGWPIGSGAVESACRQRQCRFKRPGQFWTAQGMRHLGSLTEARHNNHWDDLWRPN